MFYCLGTHQCRAVIWGDKEVVDTKFDCPWWSMSPLPLWTWYTGGFWKPRSRNAKLKICGWLPSWALIPHPQSSCPQGWNNPQHPQPHSVPARVDLLSPAGNRGWGWCLSPGPHIMLSVLGLSICTWFFPQAPPTEALLVLLPDSLLRAQNTP